MFSLGILTTSRVSGEDHQDDDIYFPPSSQMQVSSLNHGGINMEWPRGVNCVKAGGGRTLSTLHRAEELYG